MKIFVTGSTGMVGSNLLPKLKANKSFTVYAPSRKELDLLDRQAVSNYIKKLKPDFIIHLAGRVGGIKANINNPAFFLADNLLIGLHVVLSAAEQKVTQLINIASSCMYQKDMDDFLQEDIILTNKLEPTNEGYALAKISIMRLCEYISQQYNFHYKTIIPCNLYGPYDNFDLISGHMIPAAVHKIHNAKINKIPYVEIWGDGNARREFLYVEDLVEFINLVIPKIQQLPSKVNVGLGADYSINEYYKLISEVLEYNGGFKHDLTKPVGMKRKLMDIKLARSIGWEASTSIKDGIAKTYKNFLLSCS